MSGPALRIRECRLAAGLTQAEAARRSGIHRVTWNQMERGHHTNLTLKTAIRIAGALGVTLDELVVT